jgi:hypothetical protein
MAQRFMFWLNARGFLLTIALAVAGGYLLIAHRAHIGIILSYAVLLACPIIHFFMHRHGHGQGGKRHLPPAYETASRGRVEPPEPVFHELR